MKEQRNSQFLWQQTKGERGKLFIASLFSALSTVLMYAPYLIAYFIIEELLKIVPDQQLIIFLAFLTAGLILLRFLFLGLSGVYSHIAAYNILYNLRAKTTSHIGRLPLGYFSKKTSGDLKKSINEDIEKVENTLAHQLPDIAASFIAPIVIFVYLMTVNLKLALFLLIPLVLSYATQMYMFRNAHQNMKKYHDSLTEMNSAFVEYVRGMAVFKAFNMTGSSFSKLRNAIFNYEKTWVKMTRDQSVSYSIFVILTDSAPLFIIPIGGIMMLQGNIPPSAYLLFLVLSIPFLVSLKQLIELSRGLTMMFEGLGRLKEVWQEPVQISGGQLLTRDEVQKLTFDSVSFKYDQQYVLNNISFEIQRGEMIAFVGPSGAGKTTAAELAVHFFNVDEGVVTLNDIPLQEMNTQNLMEHIAFVFQDTFLMDDTMYNNVTMGGNYTMEEVRKACRAAEIHDFILSLPHGYNTKLGEAGVKVSGGQKQRFAIARALLKDAPIVILDEATSHADAENERKIQRALSHLLKNKMVITIAHRLHTIEGATRIYVFEEGRIVEQGTHQQLQAQQGLYARLCDAYNKVQEG